MRLCIPGLVAALLLPAFASAADPKRAAGTETISANGFAVLSVNIAQLWDAEGLAGLRKSLQDDKNPLVQEVKKETGLDASEIERFTVSAPASPFDRDNRSGPILYVTTRKAFDATKVAKALGAVTVAEYRKTKPGLPEGVDGKSVYVVEGKKVVVFVDDRTIAFLETWDGFEGAAKFLGALKDAKPAQDGPLAEALALAPKHTLIAAVDFSPVRKAVEAAREIPAALKPFVPMVQAERVTLTFDYGTKPSAAAKLTFFDAETAKKAEPSAKAIFALGRKALADERKSKGRDDETKAVIDPILAFAEAALESAEAKLDGKVLTMSAGGEVDAALKKSIAAFPEWAAVTSARMHTINNLKQIGIAMHSYHDAMGHLPQDITDKDGKAILSWRVELLPYIEQDNLYKKIDRSKAWDDPANKEILELMPDVFKVKGREPKEKGFTFFLSFTAEKAPAGAPLLTPGRKLKMTDITDGTSNTLMVVDGATAVNWLKPGDLPYDPKKLPKVGHDGRLFALFCDGSVRHLRTPMDTVLNAIITINGGEVVSLDE